MGRLRDTNEGTVTAAGVVLVFLTAVVLAGVPMRLAGTMVKPEVPLDVLPVEPPVLPLVPPVAVPLDPVLLPVLPLVDPVLPPVLPVELDPVLPVELPVT